MIKSPSAHRIGQMREVHIYRFISSHTIEEAMLRKANQKRSLDNIVIQQGSFDWRKVLIDDFQMEQALAQVEDEEDTMAARAAAAEIELDNTDFNEVAVTATDPDGNNQEDQDQENINGPSIGSISDYMLSMVERDWDFFGYERPYNK
jgi:helicase SWR1